MEQLLLGFVFLAFTLYRTGRGSGDERIRRMCKRLTLAVAAVLLAAENGILCSLGGQSKEAAHPEALFCRFSARKARAEDNGPRTPSSKTVNGELRRDYGFDQYGSEDSSYSTIAYADAGYHPNHAVAWEEDEVKWGGVSVSSVFQMSLTALAFLAFGGFLVNLIVHAIKDAKGNDSGGMTTTSPETLVLVPLKRPKFEAKRRKENGKDIDLEKTMQNEGINTLLERVSKLLENFPYEN